MEGASLAAPQALLLRADVEVRPSAEINMSLLSLNTGATHGYGNDHIRALYSVDKGKLLGQKPPLKLKDIWAIRIRLELDHRTRELALFNLAIDSKLRGCDLVGRRVHDVVQGRSQDRPRQFKDEFAHAGHGGVVRMWPTPSDAAAARTAVVAFFAEHLK